MKWPVLLALIGCWCFEQVLPPRCDFMSTAVGRQCCSVVGKWSQWLRGFPGASDSKESACNVGDPSLIPRLGKSPGEGNGYPLQYSCLENFMDRETWCTTAHEVTKSWTRLSDFHFSLSWWLQRYESLQSTLLNLGTYGKSCLDIVWLCHLMSATQCPRSGTDWPSWPVHPASN